MAVRLHRFHFETARAKNQAFFSERLSKVSLHDVHDLYNLELILLQEELDIVRLETVFNALINGERPMSVHMLVSLEQELQYKSIYET